MTLALSTLIGTVLYMYTFVSVGLSKISP